MLPLCDQSEAVSKFCAVIEVPEMSLLWMIEVSQEHYDQRVAVIDLAHVIKVLPMLEEKHVIELVPQSSQVDLQALLRLLSSS